jgi:hypothetical protein
MITLVLGLMAVLFVLCLVYAWATRFPECSAADILPFLRKIDMEAVYGTFHPDAEANLREQIGEELFAPAQFKRIKMAIHYCREMAHNAKFFQLWACYERRHHWATLDAVLQGAVTELRVQSLRCRIASMYVRGRLRWWLLRMRLLPWMTPPSFEDLTRHGSADLLSFYDAARDLAGAFSEAYGDDYHGKLKQAL